MDFDTLLTDLAADGIELYAAKGALHYRAPLGKLDAPRLEILRSVKPEILRYLEEKSLLATSKPIPLVPRPAIAPLTVRQRDFWSSTRPNPEPWITHSAARYRGQLDFDALMSSVALLVARHEALRTRIVERAGSPVQLIGGPDCPHVETHDFRDRNAYDSDASTRDLIQEFMHRRISPESGPLFRVCVVHLSRDEHVVAMVLDHILSDARSIAILHAELWDAYFAFTHGAQPRLPPVPLQFADYAFWEERTLSSALWKHLPFWTDYLASAPVLLLPLDVPRTTTRTLFASGDTTELSDPDTTLALRRLARQLNSTMPMLVLAGCMATLWHWTRQDDLVIRRTVSTRTTHELASTVGFLLNHVLTRIKANGDMAFTEILSRVKAHVIDSQEHADIPLNSVLSALRRNDAALLAETFSFNYLPYDMVRSYEPPSEDRSQVRSMSQYRVTDESEEAFVEMMCAVIETSDRLMARLRYARDLFRPETAHDFMESFSRLLRRVVCDPTLPLADLQLS